MIFRVLFSILGPWAIFCLVYTAVALELHHYWPYITWAIVVASWIFVVLNVQVALAEARGMQRAEEISKKGWAWEFHWQLFNSAGLALAIVLATVWGNRHYNMYWKKYYDFKALEAYVNVNPNSDSGTAFMDAGQVYFKEGSHIDSTRAVAFKNYNTYCIAPIIRQILQEEGDRHATEDTGGIKLPASGSVDFFAVGVNCCDSNGYGFACGDAKNGLARSGLRVLEADDRAFYDMATVMWTNRYNIPVKHPLFFKWSANPLTEVLGMQFQAGIYYQNQLMMQLVWNACITGIFCTYFGMGKYVPK